MKKLLFILLGSGFLGIALLYLCGVILMAVDAKSSAAHSLEAYLEFDYDCCEQITDMGTVEIEIPELYTSDYDCYRICFSVYNHSSEMYYGDPREALWWENGVLYSGYENQNRVYDKLFSEGAEMCLPGKCEVPVSMYIIVEEGVDVVTASYMPNWDEEEVFLDVSLQ